MSSKTVVSVIATALIALVIGYVVGQYMSAGAGVGQQQAQAPTYKFKMATFYLAGDPGFEAAKYFAGLVKNMSNGRIEIEVYQSGELGFPVTEIVDAVSRGTVEIGIFYTSYLAGQDPVMALAGGKPGPLSNPYDVLYYSTSLFDLVEKTFRKFGVVTIYPMIYGDVEILVLRTPIQSLEDLKGRILRSSGMAAVFYSKLGAQTMMLPSGELYTALQLGTIDGLEWTDYTANYRMGFHEVAKYVVEPTPGVNLHSEATIHAYLIINPSVWEKLPDDLKAIIKAACEATYLWTARYIPSVNREYRQKWIEAGAKIIRLTSEDNNKIVKTAIELHVEYAKKSAEAKEYVNRLVDIWRTLGYEDWASTLEKALIEAGLRS